MPAEGRAHEVEGRDLGALGSDGDAHAACVPLRDDRGRELLGPERELGEHGEGLLAAGAGDEGEKQAAPDDCPLDRRDYQAELPQVEYRADYPAGELPVPRAVERRVGGEVLVGAAAAQEVGVGLDARRGGRWRRRAGVRAGLRPSSRVSSWSRRRAPGGGRDREPRSRRSCSGGRSRRRAVPDPKVTLPLAGEPSTTRTWSSPGLRRRGRRRCRASQRGFSGCGS